MAQDSEKPRRRQKNDGSRAAITKAIKCIHISRYTFNVNENYTDTKDFILELSGRQVMRWQVELGTITHELSGNWIGQETVA